MILESLYRQYREMRKAGIQPVEVRLGEEDYYDLLRESPAYGGTLMAPWVGEQRVFGVPIKRVPLRRCVSFR